MKGILIHSGQTHDVLELQEREHPSVIKFICELRKTSLSAAAEVWAMLKIAGDKGPTLNPEIRYSLDSNDDELQDFRSSNGIHVPWFFGYFNELICAHIFHESGNINKEVKKALVAKKKYLAEAKSYGNNFHNRRTTSRITTDGRVGIL